VLCLVLRSFWLGHSLISAWPQFDHWLFVTEYLRYLDGNYSLADLFVRHGEHRIMTTRLVLFADAIWFSMRGIFPITAMYLTLAFMALLAATLVVGESAARWRVAAAFIMGLGMAWSISQWSNLTGAFQIGFAFVHLFALLTYQALAMALNSGERSSALAWFTLAGVADFFAMFSLGSGFLVGIAALAMAIWLRKSGPVLFVFAAFHVGLCVLYFRNYVPATQLYGVAYPLDYLTLAANFLAESIASKTPYQTSVGLALIACFIAAAGWASWRSIFKSQALDRGAAVFLGMASFVVLEAALTAYTRVNTGSAERYATPAIVFDMCMLAFAWRVASNQTIRGCVVLITVFIIVLANLPGYATLWRNHIAYIEGPYARQALEPASLAPWVIEPVKKMKELHLGPFVN
jgi:hypothetical protein